MTKNLVELSFDQYQRYRDVQEIANLVRGDKPLKILDMGGYPGVIRDFLVEDNATIVDILPNDNVKDYIQSDGSKLPFDDNSFDYVCSLDTLEHVPVGNRKNFLNEMIRVSRDFVVLVCPFYDEQIKLAEEIAFEFYRKTFNTTWAVLGEHLEHGLPHFEETKAIFKEKELDPIAIPSGYLFNWLPMQMVKIYLLSLPEPERLNAMIDRFYNENYYELDHRSPSYRTVLVASKKSNPSLNKVVKRFEVSENGHKDNKSSFDTFTMLMALMDLQHKNHMQGLVKEVEKTHQMLRDKDVHIGNLENIIKEREKQVIELEKWATRVQKTIPYRVYISMRRNLRRDENNA